MDINIPMIYARKALSKEELQTMLSLSEKVETYKKKLELKKGDKLRRKKDGEIFTYVERAPYGFGNVYVEELEHYVYLSDFEKIIV